MEADGSRRMYRWTSNTRPEYKKYNKVQKSSVDQSKVGGWWGHKNTKGEGKRKIQKTVDNGGAELV